MDAGFRITSGNPKFADVLLSLMFSLVLYHLIALYEC